MSESAVSELQETLRALGVQVFTIPAPTGDEKLRLEGWRDGIEKYGQELWCIYHWMVDSRGGSTAGIYRLRDWLEEKNVLDETGGAHWRLDMPASRLPASEAPGG